jgi:hypothetical protein
MTRINGDNVHPDMDVDCEYCISPNCLEESIANDRSFDRVYDDSKKKTVFICHPCAKLLWSQGELIAVRSNLRQAPANITRYEFPKV